MIITDLTMTLRCGQPGVEFASKYTVAANGWNAQTLSLYSHTGTHMDAPVHFDVNQQTLDQIPLERCLVRGHIVDLTALAPKSLITVEHLAGLASNVKPGEAILLRTGWSRFFDQPDYYRNNFPRISRELAVWLVDQQVGLLGVEPPSVADVNDLEEVTEIHQILLGGDVIIVEGLTNLERVTAGDFYFGAMPIKIGDGDGAPCRAFAVQGVNIA